MNFTPRQLAQMEREQTKALGLTLAWVVSMLSSLLFPFLPSDLTVAYLGLCLMSSSALMVTAHLYAQRHAARWNKVADAQQ